jgi:phage terminase large subunit
MQFSDVFLKNAKSKKRVVVNCGSTSSGKTYSILQLLLLIAQKYQGSVISVVTKTLPALKRGAMRDFINILQTENIYNKITHNKSNHIFYVGTSIVEFFSCDNAEKVKNGKRDYLFVNEANSLSFLEYSQLAMRTKKRIYIDYNPVVEYWVDDKVLVLPEAEYIHSTYNDNRRFLSQETINQIESYKDLDPDLWQVYGLGLIGRGLKGLIYKNWTEIDNYEHIDYDEIIYGLDFGFSNSHTAVTEIKVLGESVYVSEKIYERNLLNKDLIDKLESIVKFKSNVIVADSARPEHIEEIYQYGFNIHPANKKPGSVLQGIESVKRRKLYIDCYSKNLIKELKLYSWKKDKNDVELDEPVKAWDDLLDATRYALFEYTFDRQEKDYMMPFYVPK